MSLLKDWIYRNNYHRNNDNSTGSHLLYDGGTVYLPEDKEYEFLKLYAKDLENDVVLHYVEKRPTVFKFMIDFDIYDTYYWPEDLMIKLSAFVCEIVNEFYPTNGLNCIICKSKQKEKDNLIHSGIHVIYPKLYVNSETALMIRDAVLQKIDTLDIKAQVPWSDIFDKRIYENNGYTMVGSVKVGQDRKYMPFAIIDKNGTRKEDYLNRLLNDYFSMMLETSIRYIPDAIKSGNPEGLLPTDYPKWMNRETIIYRPTRSGNKYSSCSGYEYDIIINHIRHNIKEYKDDPRLIKEISRYADTGALLIKTNSKFCMNLNREHKNCGIYFYASRRGLCQKCLCPCDNLNGRRNGYCKDYTSEYYKFKPDEEVMLFGTTDTYIFNVEEENDFQNENQPEITEKDNAKGTSGKKKKIVKEKKDTSYHRGMTLKRNINNEMLKQLGTIGKRLMDNKNL